MNIICCNKVRKICVGGKNYNYVLKQGCTETWCQKRRAIIELAPHKFIKFHSNDNITEKEIEGAIKKHLTNYK